MATATKPVGSITQIADLIALLNSEFPTEEFLFRGQADNWSLLPRLARVTQREATDTLEDLEEKMIGELRRKGQGLCEQVPEDRWGWLAVAQHFGLPTRLLDWSINPLAALWFAVRDPDSPDVPGVMFVAQIDSEDFVDLGSQKDPAALDRTMVVRPLHVTQRITTQDAYFTVHASSEGTFAPLLDEDAWAGFIQTIEIPRRAFASLRSDLDRLGINAASLFGDLGNLCAHVEWSYTLVGDERS